MKTLLKVGVELDVEIDRLGIYGEGVARYEGFTLFVPGGLPKEVVRVRLTQCRKTFGRAKILSVLKTSPHRQVPPCSLFGKCGGCQLMHMSDEDQLIEKRQRVIDALERIGKLHCEVAHCVPSPFPLAYRNKIQLPVKMGVNGLKLGLYAHQTHELIEMDTCFIHCSLGEKVFQEVALVLARSHLTAYDLKTQQGELKTVLIKTAIRQHEALVILVTNGKGSEELTRVAKEIQERLPEVKGVIHNCNELHSNVILSDQFETLSGESFITETIAGLSFRISAKSFFQVNPAQAEQLYARALSMIDLQGKEIVLDAYCGVGTLSLILAQKAHYVIGVEIEEAAISDAVENARLNQIANVRFVAAAAEAWISTLETVDVVFLNPPRKGCEESFLTHLVTLSPKKIVYISCDPATLARDLAYLVSKGYHLQKVEPFDMFPQTTHVESLAWLQRIEKSTEPDNTQTTSIPSLG